MSSGATVSDFADAAMQRIRYLVAEALAEAEGIDREDQSIESGRFIVSARVFHGAAEIFAETRKRDADR